MNTTKKEQSLKRIANLISELQIELFNLTGSEQFISSSLILPVEKEKRISNFLYTLGIPANLIGYSYLKYLFEYLIDQPNPHIPVTKTLYPMAAEHFNTTVSSVERGIRHTIELLLKKGNLDLLHQIFSFSESKGITNSEFIYRIAEYLQKGY